MTYFYDAFSSTLAQPQESLQKLLLRGYTLTQQHQQHIPGNDDTLPSDQDLVVYFHQNQSEDRVAWNVIVPMLIDIFSRGNKRLMIVVVRRNNQEIRMKSYRLPADAERAGRDNVLLCCFEMERKGNASTAVWRKDNGDTFDRIVDFLRPKLTWYYFQPELMTWERPDSLLALFSGFVTQTMAETDIPSNQDLVVFYFAAPPANHNYHTIGRRMKTLMDASRGNRRVILVLVRKNDTANPRLLPYETESLASAIGPGRAMQVEFEFRAETPTESNGFDYRWSKGNAGEEQRIRDFVSRIPSVATGYQRTRDPRQTLTWHYSGSSMACMERPQNLIYNCLSSFDTDVTVHPNTPRNRNLVIFHYATGVDRMEWKFVYELTQALFRAGNKKVILVIARFNVQDKPLPMLPLSAETAVKDGPVLQVEFEMYKKEGQEKRVWKPIGANTLKRIETFLKQQ